MKRIVTAQIKMKKEEFVKKLKSKCKQCSDSSILAYYRTILRLYKLNSDDEDIPLNKKWIMNKTLIRKYKALHLGSRRHLSNGAVKFFQLLGQENMTWYNFMMKDSQAYSTKRSKNEKSESEEERWLKDGWKGIRKAANEFMRRERKHIFDGEPSIGKLYKYQQYIVLRLFSEVPFRNGFADLSVKKKKDNNYIEVPRKGGIKFLIRNYKNSKVDDEKEIVLSRGLSTQLKKFLKFRDQVVDNEWFLNTIKKTKLSRSALGKMVIRTTKKLLNKKIGSRIIRLLAATSHKSEIDKLKKLSNSMLHSQKQTSEYVRKD